MFVVLHRLETDLNGNPIAGAPVACSLYSMCVTTDKAGHTLVYSGGSYFLIFESIEVIFSGLNELGVPSATFKRIDDKTAEAFAEKLSQPKEGVN